MNEFGVQGRSMLTETPSETWTQQLHLSAVNERAWVLANLHASPAKPLGDTLVLTIQC